MTWRGGFALFLMGCRATAVSSQQFPHCNSTIPALEIFKPNGRCVKQGVGLAKRAGGKTQLCRLLLAWLPFVWAETPALTCRFASHDAIIRQE